MYPRSCRYSGSYVVPDSDSESEDNVDIEPVEVEEIQSPEVKQPVDVADAGSGNEAEGDSEEEHKTPKKRKAPVGKRKKRIRKTRKVLGWGKSKKSPGKASFEIDKRETEYRVERMKWARTLLSLLQPGVSRIPLDSVGDAGLKHLSVYTVIERVAQGFDMETSLALARCLFGFHEVTIRKWIKEFEMCDFVFQRSLRGLNPKIQWRLSDRKFEEQATTWLDSQCAAKQKYVTPEKFCEWLNKTLFKENPVVKETARRWMHRLGFHPVVYQKGIYKDGHERVDVIAAREKYLKSKMAADPLFLHRRPVIENLPIGKIIEIVHDECAFQANDDVQVRWSRKGSTPVLKPKSKGKGIMISMFVTEVAGILRDEKTGEPCVEILRYGKNAEGYWTSELMANHLRRAMQAAEAQFPYARLIWRFDNSTNHLAFAQNALVANRMGVKPGGGQPVMHDTVWEGKVQKMVIETGPDQGKPKGLKLVLQERGYNVKGWSLNHKDPSKHYRKVIAQHPDFLNEKPELQHLVESRGHQCEFYPRFHPELSPIELVWARLKDYVRKHCEYKFDVLERNVRHSLETVCVETIRRCFAKCRRFEAVYARKVDTAESAKVIKQMGHKYQGHRKISKVLEKHGITLAMCREMCHCSECDKVPVQCDAKRCAQHAKQ